MDKNRKDDIRFKLDNFVHALRYGEHREINSDGVSRELAKLIHDVGHNKREIIMDNNELKTLLESAKNSFVEKKYFASKESFEKAINLSDSPNDLKESILYETITDKILPEADKLYKSGVKEFDEYNFSDALKYFTDCINMVADYPDADIKISDCEQHLWMMENQSDMDDF